MIRILERPVMALMAATRFVPATWIAAAMADRGNFVYHEVPGGNHDAAVWVDVDLQGLTLVGD